MNTNTGPFDYRTALARRIQQFAHYLKLMDGRAHEEVHGNCCIIFEERPPDSSTKDDELVEQRRLVLALPSGVWPEDGTATGLDDLVTVDLPDDGWREALGTRVPD
jgi:hypothetical protein